MVEQKTHRVRWFVSTILPSCIILGGWGYIIAENRNLAISTVQNYQIQQLQKLRGLASASAILLTRELSPSPAPVLAPPVRPLAIAKIAPTDVDAAESVLVRQLLQPLQSQDHQVWLQAIDRLDQASPYFRYVDAHSDHPQMVHPELVQAIQRAPESSLVHAVPIVPVRQPMVHCLLMLPKLNRTISVWTVVSIFPGSPKAQTWMLGTSQSLTTVLAEAGVYDQINACASRMIWFTLGIMMLWWVLWRLQSDQRQYETEVDRLSRTDELTGLANRRQLHQSGELALHQLQPANPLTLIALDLDRFKPINDTLGPEAGDELLVKVAHRLKSCVRQGDVLARLDGDEFAILLQNSNDQHARICAERLLKALHQPFWVQNRAIYINGSLGIATAATPHMPFSQLLVQADIAMDRSKNGRQGGYTMFDASMHAEKIARLELERDLRGAIEYDELQVFYQPIVDLVTNQTIGYEALIRWQHRHKGQLQPAEFLPIAAEIGLSLAIERWVLKQACQQMMAWHGAKAAVAIPPSISVNLSAQQFAQADLVQYVEYVLQETGWPAHRLTIEITEEAMIQHPEQVAAVLLNLQRLGVRISLDDFGTGYSSLSYLQRFPVDVLKIDKSFIKTVNDRVQDGEIVRTIIALANSLGVGTIAEGIETLEQLNHLKSLRCQYGQGYLFAQPMKNLPPDRLLHC
jgi:diguanylate cyclase (GGDEF)-like protein